MQYHLNDDIPVNREHGPSAERKMPEVSHKWQAGPGNEFSFPGPARASVMPSCLSDDVLRDQRLRMLGGKERLAQLLRFAGPILDRYPVAQLPIELVIGVARENVLMVMPNMLIARRLIVLPRARALGIPGELHRQGNALGLPHDRGAGLLIQIVERFQMRGRNDHHVPAVITEPITSHDCCHQICLVDQIRGRAQVVLAERLVVDQLAEGTLVVGWFMGTVEH